MGLITHKPISIVTTIYTQVTQLFRKLLNFFSTTFATARWKSIVTNLLSEYQLNEE